MTSDELPVGYLDGMSRPELRESLEGERRHLVRVSEAAIRCGVAEHYVRMEEEQGRQVGQAMLAFAAETGWSLGDPRVQAAVRRALGPPDPAAPGRPLVEGASSPVKP